MILTIPKVCEPLWRCANRNGGSRWANSGVQVSEYKNGWRCVATDARVVVALSGPNLKDYPGDPLAGAPNGLQEGVVPLAAWRDGMDATHNPENRKAHWTQEWRAYLGVVLGEEERETAAQVAGEPISKHKVAVATLLAGKTGKILRAYCPEGRFPDTLSFFKEKTAGTPLVTATLAVDSLTHWLRRLNACLVPDADQPGFEFTFGGNGIGAELRQCVGVRQAGTFDLFSTYIAATAGSILEEIQGQGKLRLNPGFLANTLACCPAGVVTLKLFPNSQYSLSPVILEAKTSTLRFMAAVQPIN